MVWIGPTGHVIRPEPWGSSKSGTTISRRLTDQSDARCRPGIDGMTLNPRPNVHPFSCARLGKAPQHILERCVSSPHAWSCALLAWLHCRNCLSCGRCPDLVHIEAGKTPEFLHGGRYLDRPDRLVYRNRLPIYARMIDAVAAPDRLAQCPEVRWPRGGTPAPGSPQPWRRPLQSRFASGCRGETRTS